MSPYSLVDAVERDWKEPRAQIFGRLIGVAQPLGRVVQVDPRLISG